MATQRSDDGSTSDRVLRQQGRRTMQRLQDASEKVFDERGFHATRIDDIVAEAQASHGTFYLYFANKEDVLRSLVERAEHEMGRLAAELPGLEASTASYVELRNWVGQFADFYQRHGAVLRAAIESDTASERPDRVAHLLDLVRSAFQQRLGNGATELPAAHASLAVAVLLERYVYVVGTVDDADRVTALDVVASFVHRGLFGGG